MAKNFIQDGKHLTLIAPTGGVVSGNCYLIGATVVVAGTSAQAGDPFTGYTEGVFELPKVASLAAAQGEVAKVLASSRQVSAAAEAKTVGVFTEPAENGANTCLVRLVQTVGA